MKTPKEQELRAFITGFLTDPAHDKHTINSMTAQVFRIALAAMDAEPAGWQVKKHGGNWVSIKEEEVHHYKFNEELPVREIYATQPVAIVDAEPVADVVAWHKEGEERTCDIRWRRFDVAPGPLFAVAQPAAVVPDEMEPTVEAIKRVLPTSNPDEYAACIGADMWNACRAAMLNHSDDDRDMVEPVSQPYKLPATRFLQVADLYEMQFDDGRTCAFHTDAEKAVQWLHACDGNKVQEYVKLERLQDALTGNSPVIPDGWKLVPLEPTYQMCEAMGLPWESPRFPDRYKAMIAAAPDFREIGNSSTNNFRENTETSTKCWCRTCRPVTISDMRFVVCPECGNKRCPHAADHRHACTRSNEPGQEGSAYPAAPRQEGK
ncbi:TPA: hypothetical protein ACP4PI_000305 [Escherichia coli]